ncbi:polyprenyl synthetase family protein [Microbacterium sp. Marseille-Q6648]|uniref:polyprenyl synthetase family protein n=1 Tax=Microbacterium sp. Marseille-Q6648 TaxID=2937991 RepID=UPI00203AC9CA|nr:polyprenyl synthetase family protein [Microbacterium sp. Marseille-Q6648]
MIPRASRPDLDAAIDSAIDRIRSRADVLGDGFGALADAVGRAASGGKRFRPALVCESYDAFGGSPAALAEVHRIAAAFELLHAAFVVHDDVIDHDTVRRGIPNVAGEFRMRARGLGADAAGAALLGDAAAILGGDLLLHEALRLVALADVPGPARTRVLELLDDAVYVSAAGELADVENSVVSDDAMLDEDDASHLLATAFNKTGVYSFRAPLVAGAVLAGAPEEALDALESAADRLGLAFQLVDDLIGAFGSAEQAGRETGGDLREAKRTPLVAFARKTPVWEQVDSALAVAHTGPIAVREAQRMLEDSGARVQLRDLIIATLDEVRLDAEADVFPPRVAGLLRALADSIQERVP